MASDAPLDVDGRPTVYARPVEFVPQADNAVSRRKVRLAATALGIFCTAILAVAIRLPPSASGLGTHTSIGLPPCGFLESTGIPCPTCGMTTAFSLMAHGSPLAAFRAQPAGAVLFLLTLASALVSWRAAWTGRIPRINWDWLGTGMGLATLGVVFFGAWAWKITLHLLQLH